MPRPATVQISRTKWAILFSEQGGCCAGCFKPLDDDVHVDHVEPLARGGEDVFENLQLLHARCNLLKGDMTPAAWFGRQRRWLLAETAQIRRRQVLVTIDPEIVTRLRVAAKQARRPMSALVEDGVRLILNTSARGPAEKTSAAVTPPFTRMEMRDLFGGPPA